MNGHNPRPNTLDLRNDNTGNHEPLTRHVLAQENRRYADTGGVSRNNAGLGFRPAFLDTGSGRAYPSRFRDGSPAPFHLIEGLPADLFETRPMSDAVAVLRPGVIAGFVLGTRFYTREQAAEFSRKTIRH